MLKVQLHRGETVPFEFRKSAEIFFGKDLADEENFFGEIEIDGEIISDGKSFIARGKTSCQKNFLCDRCLSPSTEKIIVGFDEEISAENISENIADITEIVRDTFLASLPMQNLCREDCKGLCPVCGKNLNVGNCECDRLNVDPRLTALKDFFID